MVSKTAGLRAASDAKQIHMEIEFKKCRTKGHAWEDFIPPRNRHPVIYESPIQETDRCMRCESERFRGIGYTGEVEHSTIDYTDGYLIEPGEERPELRLIRLSLAAELKAIGRQRQRSTAHRTQSGTRRKKKPTPKRGAPRRAVARKPAKRRHLQAVS